MNKSAATEGRGLGVLLALAAAPCFAMSAIFGKYALNDGGAPLGVIAARFALATVLFAIVLAVMGKRWPRGPLLAKLLAIGAIGQGGMAIFFFYGLSHASAGLMALLLYLHPALIVAVEVAARWERLSRLKAFAIGLAVFGCALTAGGGGGTALGIFFGVASAVALSVYVLAAKRLAHDVDPYVASATYVAGCTLLLVLIAIVARPALPAGVTGWTAIVGLALVPTLAGTLLLFVALPRLSASDVTTLMTIEPVVTVLAGWWLFGETVTSWQIVGAVLILGSVLVLARSVRRA